jgi:transposase
LSTKIHAMVDALGNPVAFHLTAGQAHDLEGSDVFLPQMLAPALLADRAFDADKRVIEPLRAAGKTPVIPPLPGRSQKRPYDEELYKERHLIENFFCGLKQFRAIATRYDKRAANFLGGIYAAAIVIWLN